jgi:hypothetical protein
MRKTALALGAAASIGLIGATAPVALAQPGHQAAKGFHATVNVTKPKIGQNLKVKATGAKPNATYFCVLVVDHKGISGAASLADTPTLETRKSNAAGKITCNQVFNKFTGSYKNKKHSCPPTKADKRSGWGCGVGLANESNTKNFAVALFKF